MNDENLSHPAATDPAPTGKLHWSEAPIPPSILASLLLLGVVQHWGLGFLAVTGSVGDVPNPILGFVSYFIHWACVGGLVGCRAALEKRHVRGASKPTGPRFGDSVRHDYNNDSELSRLG